MEFTVNKKSFEEALRKVGALVPRAKTTKLYSLVKLTLDGPVLGVEVSYSEAYLKTTCAVTDATVGDPIVTMSKRLLDIVAASSTDITIKSEEGKVEVVSGKSKWVEPLTDTDLLSKSTTFVKAATVDSRSLLTAFNSSKYAMDSDSIRPSYYMIDVVDGRVRCCNGHQYHEDRLDIAGLTFSISANIVDGFSVLLRHFDGPLDFGHDADYYYFKNGIDTVALRKPQLTFPDLDRMLVKTLRRQTPSLMQIEKSDFAGALKKVALTAEDDYPYVEVHINKTTALLKCVRKSGAVSVCEIPCVWDSTPRVATFKIMPLADSIKYAEGSKLEVRFGEDTKDRKSPMVIEGESSWSMLNQVNLQKR